MTTKSLEYFLVVVKHLNISKAAKELFISQPALSKQISQLEAELGVSLFDRTKHSLKLTHAGEVLLSETNELFKKQDELRQRVRAAGNVSEDALRLCHMPGALNYHVADILAQFQEKYPEIRLNLIGSLPSQIFSNLLNGKIDAGFILATTTTCPEPLKMQTLHEAQLSLAVPKAINMRITVRFHSMIYRMRHFCISVSRKHRCSMPYYRFSCMEITGIIITGLSICQIWRR